MAYAILETGGKQYRVAEGDVVDVERLDAPIGERIELDRILALADDEGEVRLGSPVVEGARAVATVMDHGRAPKVVVFKYKSKVKYRRKRGHRQGYTRLRIEEIKG